MSMEDISIPADSELWRSVLSDSFNLNESTTSTEFFDLPECDQLTPSLNQTGDEVQNENLAESLIEALHKLQLESAKKNQPRQDPIVPVELPVMSSQIPVEIRNQASPILEIEDCNPEVEEKKLELNGSDEISKIRQVEENISTEPIELRTKHTNEDEKLGEKDSKHSEEKINPVGGIETPAVAVNCEKMESTAVGNMKKPIKPFSKLPAKPVPPKIRSTSRIRIVSKTDCSSRVQSQPASHIKRQIPNIPSMSNRRHTVLKRQISNLPDNTSSKNNTVIEREVSSLSNTSIKSSTVKKTATRINNIVPMVTSAKDGIKLKDEKINNFSIPIFNRKKRTQVIPFSFQSRDKKLQQKDSAATITNKKPNDIPTNLAMKKISTNDSLSSDKSVNKENKLPKANSTNLSSVRAKSISAVRPSLCADKRVRARQEFDTKVKQRQLEMEKMKTQVGLKKSEVKKIGDIGLKKKVMTTTKVVPTFKVPLGPVRSNINH